VDYTKIGSAYSYAVGNDYSKDPIHNLEVAKLDIRFGKYSKNGFMMISKLGSVIDIGKATNKYYVTTMSSDISDGINGTSTQEKDTALGTIITYAEGKWTAAGTGLQARTGYDLEDKPTEIVVDKKLNMMSRKGIAFFARNSGKITVKKEHLFALTDIKETKVIIKF